MSAFFRVNRKSFLRLLLPNYLKSESPLTKPEAYVWLLSRENPKTVDIDEMAQFCNWNRAETENFLTEVYSLDLELPTRTSGEPYPYPRGTESVVLLTDKEVTSLEQRMGLAKLSFWVKSLSDYAVMNPVRFRKYKNHRAVIETFERRELSQGHVWCEIHPAGAGYYPLWVVDKLTAALPPPSSTTQMGLFPKSE